MSSSSTKLLQKALQVKLESWLEYINGEKGPQYSLKVKEDKFTVEQAMTISVRADAETHAGSWQFPILTIIFGEHLSVSTNSKSANIPYSDPDLYKKMFAVIDHGAEHSLNASMSAIHQAMKSKGIDN